MSGRWRRGHRQGGRRGPCNRFKNTMRRHGKEKEPHLSPDGDRPHIYRKRRAHRLPAEDRKDHNMHLDGHQPHFSTKRRAHRLPAEDRKDHNMHLDGHQPNLYRRRRIRWTGVLKWGSVALVAILVLLFVLGYLWLKTKESEMRVPEAARSLDAKQKGQPVNTLVMGVDRGSVKGEGGPGRSDIMMLVSVSSDGKKAAVISIPRDTRLQIPGQSGNNKINAAHSLGGTKLAVDTVRDFTGLKINHFVEIDFEGFKRIVDAIGGVPMHLDKPINDKYAGKLAAGDQVLSGDQALVLVRARYDVKSVPGGDIDRIKNQQKFIQSMLSTVARQRNPFKIKKIIDVTVENVKTDLTFMEMFSLGRRLKGIGDGNVQMGTAPGQSRVIGGVWYYLVDMEQFQKMLETFKTRTVVETETGETTVTGDAERAGVKVKVLNGSGQVGLAAAVAKDLLGRGYQGITTGNARDDYGQTTIYYSGGNSAKAGMVAADLEGVQEPLMKANDSLTAENDVDVLVVLGGDYRKG